jgi:hypothetical protein
MAKLLSAIPPKRFAVDVYFRDGTTPIRSKLVTVVEVLPQGNGDCEGRPCVRLYFAPSLEPIVYALTDIAQLVVTPV